MEKIEIYKTIITLKRIVEATALYLKKDLQLPTLLIEDLDKIGDMGKTIEDYWERTKDTHVVAQIEKINRATLFQLNSWRGADIEQKTMISVTNCIRSLRCIIQQHEAEEPQQIEPNTAEQNLTNETVEPEKCIIPDDILQELKDSGMIGDAHRRPLKWLESKFLLAYFVVGMCEKYSLKHGVKRKIAPFEKLFNLKGITTAINDVKKRRKKPVKASEIESILNLSKNFYYDNFVDNK